MPGKYYCIMESGNIDGKAGFRLLGNWMCRSVTPDNAVSDDLSRKLVLKMDNTILCSNGAVSNSDENGRWSITHHVDDDADVTIANTIKSVRPLNHSDDRFELAAKIIELEIMREMKAMTEDQIPPQCRYEKDVEYDIVAIDCIVLVDINSNLVKFYESAVDALSQYVRRFRKKTGEIQHFWHDSRLFTIAVPSDGTSMERMALHLELNIPTDRPVFSESMNIYFKAPSKLIKAIHRSIPAPTANVDCVTVEGNYCYYHYMVDKLLDDKGWGCAYRSLQTICSWFLLNGYANRPVPTIRQIQEMLVLIGDKQMPFINSPKWIGTMETSYILEHYLDVSCRIIHMNDIKELSDHFFTLLSHFRNTRCPVMIGGGSLAHTILGVCYNEEQNIQKYLVLDPHYTEEDVLSNIIDKGFCGWKDLKFWKGSSYYNLCLPIPPKTV